MIANQPMIGPGIFHWNTGGWFGAQLGGTAWMLLAALWMAPLNPWLAALWLLCFAVVNTVGTWLWLQRDQIAPHTAFEFLAMLVAGGGLLILVTLDWWWPASVPRESLWQGYATFFAAPIVMAVWYILERLRAKSGPPSANREDQGATAERPRED
jgi:hypothetical protein